MRLNADSSNSFCIFIKDSPYCECLDIEFAKSKKDWTQRLKRFKIYYDNRSVSCHSHNYITTTIEEAEEYVKKYILLTKHDVKK